MPRGRPSYLPPQEDYTGTYMENPGTAYEIQTLRPTTRESAIRNIWADILHESFPRHEGYLVRQETEPIPGRSLRADCKVFHFEQNRNPHRMEFLGIECKQGHYETQGNSWDLAQEQLITYLIGFRGSPRVFGAICMGKNVRFYRFFPAQDDEPATLEEMDADFIRIDRQPQTVVRRLEYIKNRVS
ncbi:unnamed protein product [Clonostachys chloroleuca]|uniref:Uncharacterized protein n=1 Tax=Clonostachys chloroleuca TaxID=1926264 RepID=A0AA35PTN6_9HYPO|nr:unnamed protein product [Clonostachys chloroleuca]